jgi:hypothetical protein
MDPKLPDPSHSPYGLCAGLQRPGSLTHLRVILQAAAHELAKFSVFSNMFDCFWEDSASNCVTKIVASDLAELVE